MSGAQRLLPSHNIRQTHAGVYPIDSGFLKDGITHHFPLQMSGQNMSSHTHPPTHLPCMIRARNEMMTHLAPNTLLFK